MVLAGAQIFQVQQEVPQSCFPTLQLASHCQLLCHKNKNIGGLSLVQTCLQSASSPL